MNSLEKYIIDHKSQFEEEPPAGHFERMQQKMNRKSKRIIVLRLCISFVASIAAIIIAGVLWLNIGKQNDSLNLCENAIDMKLCYLEKMNEVANQIEILTENFDSWDRQQLMIDVQNIINDAGNDFESEIPEELSAKETKLILSDYYRQNLESLEMIAEELRVKN